MDTTIAVDETALEMRLDKIKKLLTDGMELFLEAGTEIVKIIDEVEGGKDWLLERSGLSVPILTALERVGRKQWHPELMLETRLNRALRRLSYSDQSEVLKKGFDMMVRTQSGFDTIKVSVENADGHLNQLIDGDRLRDLAAQRSWLEQEQARERQKAIHQEVKTPPSPYEVRKGKLIVGSVSFDEDLLLSILQQMRRAR